MTLRDIATQIRASGKNEAEQLRLAQATAWFTEAFARTKKLPDLERILRPANELAPAERTKRQVDKLQRLAMVTGGEVMEIKH
jgi:hypothetical protein